MFWALEAMPKIVLINPRLRIASRHLVWAHHRRQLCADSRWGHEPTGGFGVLVEVVAGAHSV